MIDKDARAVNDLFVDRYGATRISPLFDIRSGFEVEVLESVKPVVLELYSEDEAECLHNSIPIKQLFESIDIKFRKEDNSELAKRYDIKELPALLFFQNGKLAGKIEGYYNENQKEELKKKVFEIISP